MRKFTLPFLTFILFIFVGFSYAEDLNLTFEDDSDIGNWDHYDETNWFTVEAHAPTGGVGGSGALLLSDAGFTFLAKRPLTATVGAEYTLTMDVKTVRWDDQPNYPIYVTVQGIDDTPDTVYINNSADFTMITLDGVSANTAGYIKIEGFNNGGQDSVWVDNVSFAEMVGPTLFFSQYIEGSGNNKAFEIYNGTGSEVDLSDYTIKQSHNGVGWDNDPVAAAYVLDLTGMLADGEVYVIYANTADSAIIAVGDLGFDYGDTLGARIPYFNGDDALGLFRNGTLVDIIGDPDNDPGSAWDVAGVTNATGEHTLIRKNAVTMGDTSWTAAAGTTAKDGQWRVLSQDDFRDLGSHTVGGYPIVSIRDLQYVPDPATSEASIFLGDTIVVQAMTMMGHNELWIGARWSTFVIDQQTFPDPWSGFFIVQNDSFAIGTQFSFIEPGMIVNFTGVMATFGGLTQLNLITDPVIPIEILSAGNEIPEPVLLTAADLNDPANGEQWEGMFATMVDLEMVNPNAGSDRGSFTDASGGTAYISEYFQYFDDQFTAGLNPWPTAGTRFTLTGWIREEGGIYSLNPRNDDDIIILTNPPQIDNVGGEDLIIRTPGVPTSSDQVVVNAHISDNSEVASATLHYSVNETAFIELSMTRIAETDTFTATIPEWGNGDVVRYFITATDDDEDFAQAPSDTSRATGRIFFYTVRDDGLTIPDVQTTLGYAGDNSGYAGSKGSEVYEVTLTGIVMIDSSDREGDTYIQDAAAPWSGMWVNSLPRAYSKGDEVSVTGFIEENFGVTRMDNTSNITLLNAGVGAFDPVVLTTGDFNNTVTEDYESVLIQFNNAEVTVEFPDGYPGFGEFTISDGSGDLRVDDAMSGFSGQGPDTTYVLGQMFPEISGIGYFSFGNPKLLPRNPADVGEMVSGLIDNGIQPETFSLEQNYPNPFNPTTRIKYQIAKSVNVKLAVYDIIGREVATLVNGAQSQGSYVVTFNASQLATGLYFYKLEAGDFVKTQKMLLIK